MSRAILIALTLFAAAPALAQDAAVDAARTAGTVGESADGYLGVRPGASADIRARVDQINIKRRAAYTDLAAKRGVSVSEVAAATACQLLETVGSNEWWRNQSGTWQQRTAGQPVQKPDYCG